MALHVPPRSCDRSPLPERSQLDLIEHAAALADRAGDLDLMGRAIEALGFEIADRDPVTRGMLELDGQLRSAAALQLGAREPIGVTSAAAASMRALGSAASRVEPATIQNSDLGRSHDLIGPERKRGTTPSTLRVTRMRAHAGHAGYSPANPEEIRSLSPFDPASADVARSAIAWGERS